MVERIYVEKKPGFDVEAKALERELREILGVASLSALRLVNRYDVEGISPELFERCVPTVFSEPQVDATTRDLFRSDDPHNTGVAPVADGAVVFAVEALPGQFDQR
ncbi:MAG TPA: hypothetical protein DCP91_08670, partial [Eggerthellaceae bacterium]|nr:hypothetical protein [Eggerthellaceae bacterium]